MGGKKHNKRLHKKAIGIKEQLEKALHIVDNLGIDNFSELRWLQDYLHEDIDIAVMRTSILISRTDEMA